MSGRKPKDDGIKRCPKCGAGPLGNCGFYGCETPRNTCPISKVWKLVPVEPNQEMIAAAKATTSAALTTAHAREIYCGMLAAAPPTTSQP